MKKIAAVISISLLLLLTVNSFAKVYMTRDEALKTAFPGADRIEKNTVFLSPDQINKIESLARARLTSKLYTFYVGMKGDSPMGYAVIDTHLLKTTTETVMIVINPDGTMRQVEVLAFFEPPDFAPAGGWMALFNDRSVNLKNDSMRIGRGIPNITGATITSNALVDSVRKVLAVYQVAVEGRGNLAVKGRN